MAGYNITCDPGDLYSRRCYTTDPTSGKKQEIIGYTKGGDPISKGESTSSWMAWVPTLTTLNDAGTAYQPYGEAGIPYTLGGGSAIGAWMPSTGVDMQDYYYLNEVAPGSQARKMYNNRVCNPLWPTFGCRTEGSGLQTAPTTEQSSQSKSLWKKIFGAEETNKFIPYAVGGIVGLGIYKTLWG